MCGRKNNRPLKLPTNPWNLGVLLPYMVKEFGRWNEVTDVDVGKFEIDQVSPRESYIPKLEEAGRKKPVRNRRRERGRGDEK